MAHIKLNLISFKNLEVYLFEKKKIHFGMTFLWIFVSLKIQILKANIQKINNAKFLLEKNKHILNYRENGKKRFIEKIKTTNKNINKIIVKAPDIPKTLDPDIQRQLQISNVQVCQKAYVKKRGCGGFQRVAMRLLAAVRPANSACFFF